MIGGFRWQDLKWLAYVTVWLQVSDYSQLSDYNFADYLMQNAAVYAPITFEEIVMVMINPVIASFGELKRLTRCLEIVLLLHY